VLPLPSTVVGAISAKILEEAGSSLCPQATSFVQYGGIAHALGLLLGEKSGDINGGVVLRGPYLYVEYSRGSTIVRVICSPHERGLLCIDYESLEARFVRVSRLPYTGIALDNLAKSVLEGYVYTSVMHDIHATAHRIAEDIIGDSSLALGDYGVLVEVYAQTDKHDIVSGKLQKYLNGRIVALGGEQRPFKIRVLQENPVHSIVARIAEEAGECVYWHIGTPILLCGNIPGDVASLVSEVYEKPLPRVARRLVEAVLSLAGLEPCERLGREFSGKIVFSAVGLGYDVCINKRRPYCPALMPGPLIPAKPAKPKSMIDVYIRGVGEFRGLGWGTILPFTELPEAGRK
jgi:hypothetical protein